MDVATALKIKELESALDQAHLVIAATEKELATARKNVSELEQALEESESLVTALASALTAAGGENAMIDVAHRLKGKDRGGVFT